MASLSEQEWNKLFTSVHEKLSNFYRSIGTPVTLTEDGQIHLSEYAMIPEKPYVVRLGEDTYEFVRQADGSIVMSELLISEK